MGLVLYDNADSTNAIKVRLGLAELGLEAEVIPVPLHGAKPAGYGELHPFSLVPVLADGDLTVTESNTMLRYLAEREGRADLRGADPAARARVDVLLDSLSLELRPKLWAVEEVVVYDLAVTMPERDVRVAALAGALDAFDALLDPAGPYALGAMTIADWALAGRLLHLPSLSLPAGTAPRLQRALAAVHERPAWSRALEGVTWGR